MIAAEIPTSENAATYWRMISCHNVGVILNLEEDLKVKKITIFYNININITDGAVV